ncbi:uncharacterized protein LOC119662509 [Teleopsis dalmanni]|uniref:uncharacterized protein LOC119662509 n=1 Tax=Teleopsis dalmanni TaxID=139649 RepID=UPI0018CE4C47|nr:uncharacterized protein LOC119662509 [Teleopsis dalmanni]
MINNPFRKQQTNKNTNNRISEKTKQWGKIPFKPKSAAVGREHAGNSTPWAEFKNQILETNKHADAININTEDAKQHLKKREENYRRNLIVEKRKLETVWDDFGEAEESNDVPQNNIDQKFVKSPHVDKQNNKQKNNKFKKKFNRQQDNTQTFINEDLLKNFDSKKLTFEQNNKLRKVITANTMLAKNNNLSTTIKNIKHKQGKNIFLKKQKEK